MTIPAITMLGTRPVFYKIPVRQELSDAVTTGQYSVSETEVVKCVVLQWHVALRTRRRCLTDGRSISMLEKGCLTMAPCLVSPLSTHAKSSPTRSRLFILLSLSRPLLHVFTVLFVHGLKAIAQRSI
ncbi:hypothetical protein EDD18DRAFT_691350 [Armillaria luteobubalina]|uniref:Uncharacterized protein n=1 Tax=Armillaria luteobubalina TaxID=153913 RepID=A0AA39QIU0_9AGAR|nr:hypothetical protein EDD18DRAFT_691350 [Armillaria luteobubalina]